MTTLPVIALVLVSFGSPLAPEQVASVELVATVRSGTLTGSMKITFSDQARVFFPERWGLAPTTNYWFFLTLKSADATFHLRYCDTAPKWPYEKGVREVAPGDVLEIPFEVHEESSFCLRTPDERVHKQLPPGLYIAEARFEVPGNYPVRRLGLTVFKATAKPVELESRGQEP